MYMYIHQRPPGAPLFDCSPLFASDALASQNGLRKGTNNDIIIVIIIVIVIVIVIVTIIIRHIYIYIYICLYVSLSLYIYMYM